MLLCIFQIGVFLLLAAEKKDTENGAAVTSLMSFLLCDDFRLGVMVIKKKEHLPIQRCCLLV